MTRTLLSLSTGTALVILLGIIASGCDNTMQPDDNDDRNHVSSFYMYSLTGPVEFEEQLPEDARLLVLWPVRSTERNGFYVFGEGSIDTEKSTYTINFSWDLPARATNWYITNISGSFVRYDLLEVGVGRVIVTTDQYLRADNEYGSNYPLSDHFHGSLRDAHLIYRDGEPRDLDRDSCIESWLPLFHDGFSVGTISDIDTCDLDGFVPFRSGGPTLVISSDESRFPTPIWSESQL